MFDAARALLLIFSFGLAVWRRERVAAIAVLAAAYLFVLVIASGIAVRTEGPMEPAVGLVLALVGPSLLPRGALPHVPLASFAMASPVASELAMAFVLWAAARLLDRRVARLPLREQAAAMKLDGLSLVLVLDYVFALLGGALALLPSLLGMELLRGNAGW